MALASAAASLPTARQDLGTSGFGHGLGFHQAQAGQLANDFDDFDLLGAGILEDDIEFGLLFDGFGGSGSGTGSSHSGNRSGGGNAPLLFQHLDQFSSFQNGQGAQFFNKFSRSAISKPPYILSVSENILIQH